MYTQAARKWIVMPDHSHLFDDRQTQVFFCKRKSQVPVNIMSQLKSNVYYKGSFKFGKTHFSKSPKIHWMWELYVAKQSSFNLASKNLLTKISFCTLCKTLDLVLSFLYGLIGGKRTMKTTGSCCFSSQWYALQTTVMFSEEKVLRLAFLCLA